MAIQVPPAVGSSGQFIESVIVTSSQNRHVMVIGAGDSTAYAPVTSSGGVSVAVTNPSTAVTVTNPSTAVNVVNTVTVLSASSGLVQISGTPTVLSASSGLIQLTSAPLVIAASSAGHQVGSLTSGIVSPSSNWTVVSTATTVTSGTITLSSATSLSSGTVTLSSAPLVVVATSGGTFTVGTTGTLIIVSASSGLVQISGTPTVVSASSGLVQAIVTGSSGVGALVSSGGSLQVITTASASGSTGVSVFGFGTTAGSTATQTQAIVTTSGALLVSGTPGSVSTAVNILGSTGTMVIAFPNATLAVADVGSRTVKGSYKLATSYIPGAAATQVLLGMVVTTSLGSASTTKSAAIKDIRVDTDSTAANLNFFVYSIHRGTTSGLPANGQTLVPQLLDTVTTSSICVLKVLSSVLSSTTVTSGALWASFAPRQNTMVGISEAPPLIFGRESRESDDVILRAGETLFVLTTVSNLAATRHIVTISWDEFTT